LITSTSLAIVLVNSASGSVAYARQGRIDYRSGLILALATVPGSILGVFATRSIDRGPFTVIFSLVLIGVAVLLFARPSPRERIDPMDSRTRGWRRVLVDRRGQVYMYSFSLPQAGVMCLAVGFLSSLLGIGGGFILVPAFILIFGFPTYVATATSQFMLVVMTIAGTATHIFTGGFRDSAPPVL